MNKKKTEELTWAEVKAMFAENERRFAESRAEADRRQAEADKRKVELDKLWAESNKLWVESGKRLDEVCRRVDKVCGQVGGIDENIGHHAEQFFQDSFAQTLAFGSEKYSFMLPNLKYMDRNGSMEFDIVLVNGKSVAIIEVKNRIHPDFVKDLAEKRIVKFRQYFPQYKKHKAYLGVAGFSFCDDVVNEAQKLGVGIIKQVGNSVEVDAGHLKAY